MSTVDDADAFNEAIKEPAPSISHPQSVLVELHRGLINPLSGEWQTTAEVRELNGEDEEFLASLENNKKLTYAMYVNTLVTRATLKIGDIEVRSSKSVIEDLIIGDRDTLLLAIVKATYGPERTFKVTCQTCRASNDITINLDDDFPIRKPSVDLRTPFTIKLKDGHIAKFRYPVGADNIAMGKADSVAQQSTILIARCVILPDTKDSSYNESWAKSLGLKDRNNILQQLLGQQVGPDLREVNTQCASCSADINVNIDWVSLLLA